MNFRTNILMLAAALTAPTIHTGCSVNLAKYDLQDYPKAKPFFEPITLAYDGKSRPLEDNLQKAYSAAIDTVFFPSESCHGKASIVASAEPDGAPDEWGIGAAFIPFWPALPVSETWHYHMDVQISCNGATAFKAEFEESEHVEAFWFGRMRADLVNDASQEMHRKLLERLKFETQIGRSTDLNSAQDF